MDELINKLQGYIDDYADSDWKYGKNYGLLLAIEELKKYIITSETGKEK